MFLFPILYAHIHVPPKSSPGRNYPIIVVQGGVKIGQRRGEAVLRAQHARHRCLQGNDAAALPKGGFISSGIDYQERKKGKKRRKKKKSGGLFPSNSIQDRSRTVHHTKYRKSIRGHLHLQLPTFTAPFRSYTIKHRPSIHSLILLVMLVPIPKSIKTKPRPKPNTSPAPHILLLSMVTMERALIRHSPFPSTNHNPGRFSNRFRRILLPLGQSARSKICCMVHKGHYYSEGQAACINSLYRLSWMLTE